MVWGLFRFFAAATASASRSVGLACSLCVSGPSCVTWSLLSDGDGPERRIAVARIVSILGVTFPRSLEIRSFPRWRRFENHQSFATDRMKNCGPGAALEARILPVRPVMVTAATIVLVQILSTIRTST